MKKVFAIVDAMDMLALIAVPLLPVKYAVSRNDLDNL